MGKAPVPHPYRGPFAEAAKAADNYLKTNTINVLGVNIVPLGGFGAHVLYAGKNDAPEKPVPVVSGSARLDGSKVRVHHSDVTMGGSAVPGTPDHGKPSARNTASVTVQNPLMELDLKSGRLNGSVRVLIDDSQYPQGLVDPTDLQLIIQSEAPKLTLNPIKSPQFNISTGIGPMQAKFKLQLSVDPARLLEGGKLDASGIKDVLSGPGFDLSGVVQFAIVKKIPILRWALESQICHIRSPSTKKFDKPLSKAPVDFALDYKIRKLIPVPAGAIFETQGLGFGMTGGSWRRDGGSSYTIAATPVPSVTNLGEVSLYLYMDYYRVWRVGDNWEVDVNLSFSPSLASSAGSEGPADLQKQWAEASDRSWLSTNGDFVHGGDKPVLFGKAGLKYTWD